jgi:hypothetical protein
MLHGACFLEQRRLHHYRYPPEFFSIEMVNQGKTVCGLCRDADHESITPDCSMALVSITEAAKLVRRNRSTLYRDIERGRLSKTVTPEGEAQIETSELLRTYGRLHGTDGDDSHGASSRDHVKLALLEERNRSLERALALEAELRKVKDQVTNELRARLTDKDNVIKVLESKVLFLEYDKQIDATPLDNTADAPPKTANPNSAEKRMPRKGWWARILGKR